MNTSPSSVTGTNDTPCSTIAAPMARSSGTPKKDWTAIWYAAWNPPTAPGVGIATPTTRIVITRNEPTKGNVI